MGGWPLATLQGVGQTGEDIAQGQTAAQTQQHQFTMDFLANQARNRQLDLQQSQQAIERTGQAQAYTLAQQQHALSKTMMEDAGYRDMGASKQPDGSWGRTFVNPRTNQKTIINLGPAAPPDSYEYKNAIFEQIKQSHPNIPDDYAMSMAFGASAVKPNDRQAIWEKAYQDAKDHPEYLKKGETPRQFADTHSEDLFGPQAAIRAAFGGWPNANLMDGLTTGEMNLFTSWRRLQEDPINRQMQIELGKVPPAGVMEPWTQTHAKAIQAIHDKYAPDLGKLDLQGQQMLSTMAAHKARGGDIADLLKGTGATAAGPGAETGKGGFTPPTAKIISRAGIEKAAKDHGVSVDVATKQAQAQGYQVQ